MKRTIIITLAILLANSAHASTYNYVCKDHGKSYTLTVDDTKDTLQWKGTTYGITPTDCGKAGWRAEHGAASFEFCTATKGYADFELGGSKVICDLKRQ